MHALRSNRRAPNSPVSLFSSIASEKGMYRMIPSLVASVTIEKTWKENTKRTHRLHGDAAPLFYANDGSSLVSLDRAS